MLEHLVELGRSREHAVRVQRGHLLEELVAVALLVAAQAVGELLAELGEEEQRALAGHVGRGQHVVLDGQACRVALLVQLLARRRVARVEPALLLLVAVVVDDDDKVK